MLVSHVPAHNIITLRLNNVKNALVFSQIVKLVQIVQFVQNVQILHLKLSQDSKIFKNFYLFQRCIANCSAGFYENPIITASS